MNNLIKVIFWDFDGVIIDSNKIRDFGFEKVLNGFADTEVKELLDYHRLNGGLSRYNKFRYFFENIRKESVSEEVINSYASAFSDIVFSLLCDSKLIIPSVFNFIVNNFQNFSMHITSGSDEQELRKVCDFHRISDFFLYHSWFSS